MPEGWSWTRIQNITQICLGLTHTPKYVESGIPFYSVKDISSGGLDTTNPKYISAAEFEKFPDGAKPQYGDILFGRVGTLGKPTIVNTNSPFGIFVSLGFFRKYSHEITSEFFVHWMNSSLFWDQVNMNVKGAVLTNLNTGWLSKFLIPIPPSKEQARIVAQCEIAIRYLEEIENTGREISNLISATKSKILDLAIRGKLVPQEPNDEPASILLERIRAEKEELIKQGKIKRDKKESVIFKGDDNSYYQDLPQNWQVSTLREVTTPLTLNDGDWILSENMTDNGEVKLLQLGSIGNMSYIDKGFKYLTKDTFDELSCTEIFAGYLIINRIISDKMCCCIVPDIDGTIITTVDTCWIAPSETSYDIKFLMYQLASPSFQSAVLLKATGTTRKRISKNNLIDLHLLLPPLAEQRRIVHTIEALFAQIDKISEQIS